MHQHTAPSAYGGARSESAYGAPESKGTDQNGVELVSVPVLGPEYVDLVRIRVEGADAYRWKRDELHAMTRRGEAEAKREKRTRAWKSFKRDQRGLCGIAWLSRKVIVIFAFFFVIA